VREFTIFAPSDAAIQQAYASGSFNFPEVFATRKNMLAGIVAYHAVPQVAHVAPTKRTAIMETLLSQGGCAGLGARVSPSPCPTALNPAFLARARAVRTVGPPQGRGLMRRNRVPPPRQATATPRATKPPSAGAQTAMCTVRPLQTENRPRAPIDLLPLQFDWSCMVRLLRPRNAPITPAAGGTGSAKVAGSYDRGCAAVVFTVDTLLQPCCQPMVSLLSGLEAPKGSMTDRALSWLREQVEVRGGPLSSAWAGGGRALDQWHQAVPSSVTPNHVILSKRDRSLAQPEDPAHAHTILPPSAEWSARAVIVCPAV
jgi:hypothetical protein